MALRTFEAGIWDCMKVDGTAPCAETGCHIADPELPLFVSNAATLATADARSEPATGETTDNTDVAACSMIDAGDVGATGSTNATGATGVVEALSRTVCTLAAGAVACIVGTSTGASAAGPAGTADVGATGFPEAGTATFSAAGAAGKATLFAAVSGMAEDGAVTAAGLSVGFLVSSTCAAAVRADKGLVATLRAAV